MDRNGISGLYQVINQFDVLLTGVSGGMYILGDNIGALQQKFVDDMKLANEDGKLTEKEIKELNSSLIAYTKDKMTPEIINLIVAAGIDINKFILDSGEYFIQERKYE